MSTRNYYHDYLMHYGVLGMKWGVRRYQNKDGSLTAEGKKHVSDYNKSRSLKKKIDQESAKLIKSDKRLRADFGDGTDDPDYLEYVASSYGINTKSLRKAMVDSADFYRDNSESIKTGRKIVEKVYKKDAPDTQSYINQTGSYEEYMRS